MSFNPDPSKQTQEVVFSRKTKKEHHRLLAFNNNNISETNSLKHLGVVLNNCLSFEDHLKITLNKNKTTGLLHKFQNIAQFYTILHCSLYKKCLLHLSSITMTHMANLIMIHFIKN